MCMKKNGILFLAAALSLTSFGAAQAQGTFSGVDDGQGTVFYTNSGSVDHHLSLKVDSFGDQVFQVIVEDAKGAPVATILVENGATNPVITVPPGGRVRTSDTPADTDQLAPSGTYSVS